MRWSGLSCLVLDFPSLCNLWGLLTFHARCSGNPSYHRDLPQPPLLLLQSITGTCTCLFLNPDIFCLLFILPHVTARCCLNAERGNSVPPGKPVHEEGWKRFLISKLSCSSKGCCSAAPHLPQTVCGTGHVGFISHHRSPHFLPDAGCSQPGFCFSRIPAFPCKILQV